MKAPACPAIEALENRLLLAGNVLASVSGGILRIQGDATASIIALDQSGLHSRQVRISGASGTTINGQADPIVMRGITGRVVVRMGGGGDQVTMDGLILPGSVLVSDQRHLTVNNVQVTGTLRVLGRTTTTLANTSVGEDLLIQAAPGSGDRSVDLQSVTVGRNTSIVGGSGADTVTVDDSIFRGTTWLQTGLGDDLVQIESHGDASGVTTRFQGPTSLLLGAGNDTLELGVDGQSGNRAVFTSQVLFNGQAGFDTLLSADNTTFRLPLDVQIVNFESNALGQRPINLGAAAAFAVMATASISSTGTSVINGDVGLNPGSSQGIPPAQVNGTIHVNDPAIVAARADLLAAYNDAVSRTFNSRVLPGNLGGLTFTPGLYTNSTSVMIEGSGPGNDVTLDAQGDPNAIFIFKIGSTLTTGPGAHVVLAGGAKAANIFWQVGTSATLNTTTIFKGNILAAVTITVNTGSVVRGRLLAGSNSDGSVTVNASTVSVPAA